MMRRSGLPVAGDVAWGTHLCHFFESQAELVDALVPFVAAGLANNERCIWITSAPLPAADARAALAAASIDLDPYLHSGQLEILNDEDWPARYGPKDPHMVVSTFLDEERRALARGFEGLRIAAHPSWFTRSNWKCFTRYEATIHDAFQHRRIIALCSYGVSGCGADEIVDVLRNHHFALVRRDGSWQAVPSATSALAALAPPDVRPGATVERPRESVERRHAMRLYGATFCAHDMADFLASALKRGRAAFVAATDEHRRAIGEELERRHVRADALVAQGRLVMLDANTLAKSLLVPHAEGCGAGVDAEQFRQRIDDTIEVLATRHGSVVAYGEVVDVLCRAGRHAAAHAVERLWNGLLDRAPLDLLCGYSLDAFASNGGAAAFTMACQAHGTVLPSPWSTLESARLADELAKRERAIDVEAQRRRAAELERDRLVEMERRTRAQAEALTDHLVRLQTVTSALSQAVSSSEVVDVIVNAMAWAARADEAALAILEGDTLHVVEHGGEDLSPLPAEIALDAPVPMAAASRTSLPIWLPSRLAIAEQFPQLEPGRNRAIACLPMLVRADKLGVVCFGFADERDFSCAERALLEDLAKQAGLALERARLYEEAKQSTARLRALGDAAVRFSEAPLELDGILSALCEEVLRHLGHGCGVLLRGEDPDRLEIGAARHVRNEPIERVRAIVARTPLRVGSGIVGNVVSTGQGVILPRLEAEALAVSAPELRAYILDQCLRMTIIVVPLRARGAVHGVVVAAREATADGRKSARRLGETAWPQPFDDDDLAFVQELADRAAMCIDNALLYRRVDRERRRAEAANRAKDEFVAMLGHELRNPLSPIVTALDLLRLRDVKGVERERLIIERQVKTMVRLIDDLLDIPRITRGKIQLSKHVVEASAVVAKAVEMASPLLERRRHRLVLVVPPEGLAVEVDEARIAQVLTNLLINAAKFTSSGGNIAVLAERAGGEIVLRVRDDGVGIGPELLPRIFDLFTQSDRTLDRSTGGLGIGLTIARSLVELHGGTIHADSEGPGKGSEFVVRLPASAAPAAEAPPSAPATVDAPLDPRATPHRRVLVVDDNRDAAEELAQALRELGYVVGVAYDGPSALAMADVLVPDIALVDIGLPAMNGYELALHLRARPALSELGLVAVTGYGQDADRARAKAAGFFSHLVKPVELADLRAAIEAGQGKRRGPSATAPASAEPRA